VKNKKSKTQPSGRRRLRKLMREPSILEVQLDPRVLVQVNAQLRAKNRGLLGALMRHGYHLGGCRALVESEEEIQQTGRWSPLFQDDERCDCGLKHALKFGE